MARNRSEKSPSGVPRIDEYLRAWLRSRRGDDHDSVLRNERERLCNLLADSDHVAMNAMGSDAYISGPDVERIYGQEPEFIGGRILYAENNGT